MMQILFRQTPGNKFTIPLLMNLIENSEIADAAALCLATSRDTLARWIEKSERCLVIYSFMSPQLPDVWEEVKDLKLKFGKKIYLLAGGPHPTGSPDTTLKMGCDAVISGAGESVFVQIVTDILDDWTAHRGDIIHGECIRNLETSFPISKTIPFMPPLEIMRGCTYRCRFCQTGHLQKPVRRSLESARAYFDEMEKRRFKDRTGFICPSGFEYGEIGALLQLAASKNIRHIEYGIFPSELHPGTITKEGLRLIKRHCSNRKITLGAQSGSNSMLQKIRRGHTIEDIEAAAAQVTEEGFRPILDFIVGFPGETEADRLETLDWIRKLNTKYKARTQLHYFIPIAGTAMEHEKPTLPGETSRAIMDKYYRSGTCTQWWRTGFEMSWRLIHTLERLNAAPESPC